MDKRDKTLIIVAIVICVIISCLSPFIASGDPDGLEKSAEDAGVGEDVATEVFASPFPDYSYEPLESIGEVGVLILGALLTLICGFAVGEVVKRKG
ncbi:PDGLE domain-containing protein [Methanobrevibacter sp.]|uniref:PDGLE domain-containing protein n=1 Tax=Methanobrevibacter sp. TaxID=66852 RepID=UPI00388DA44A